MNRHYLIALDLSHLAGPVVRVARLVQRGGDVVAGCVVAQGVVPPSVLAMCRGEVVRRCAASRWPPAVNVGSSRSVV